MHYGAHNSPLSPRTFTISFITADIFALVLQSVGGGLTQMANTGSDTRTGENVMLAGLSFQVISLLIFIFISTRFFWNVARERREIREASREGKGEEPAPDGAGYRLMIAGKSFSLPLFTNVELILKSAYTLSTILLLVRSLFRVAELTHGFRSELANNEIVFVILEGCVVLGATVLMSVFHPGLIIGEAWVESGWKKDEVEKKEFDLESVYSGEEVVYMRPWYGNSVSS